MSHQDTQVQSQPQADGDNRPFDVASEADEIVFDLGTMPRRDPLPMRPRHVLRRVGETGQAYQARRILHLEQSRRPDFVPMTVAEQLGASLVAQTGTAIGEVLNAIQRKCLLDLMPAWTRLLKVYGITVNGQSRTALRRDWFWGEAFDAIVMALCYGETEYGPAKWLVADMVLRGEAAVAAEHAARSLREYEASPEGRENADMLRENLAAYRAFAEGRER